MKVIYNVTCKVEESITDEWLNYMIDHYIPEIINTHCFQSYRISRILAIDEGDGSTYTTQFTAEKKEDFDDFLNKYAVDFQRKMYNKFGEKALTFCSTMTPIKEG